MSRSSPHRRGGEGGACQGLEVHVGALWISLDCRVGEDGGGKMMRGGHGPSSYAIQFGIGPKVTAEPLD